MFSADWWESRCHLWKNSKPNDRQNPSVMAEFLGPSRLFFFRQGASRLTIARRRAQRKRVSARLVPDSIESLVHVLTTANFSPHVVYLYAGRIHCGKNKTNPSSVFNLQTKVGLDHKAGCWQTPSTHPNENVDRRQGLQIRTNCLSSP